jgi:hypothetical protein
MSLSHPRTDCVELAFKRPVVLPETAEMALEDYARALTRSEQVEAVGCGGSALNGVHLCRPKIPMNPDLLRDLEDFALDLERRSEGGGGLGWS